MKGLDSEIIVVPHAREGFSTQIEFEPARSREILQGLVGRGYIEAYACHGAHGIREFGVLRGTVGTSEENDGRSGREEVAHVSLKVCFGATKHLCVLVSE